MAMTDGKGGLMTEVEEACFHAKRDSARRLFTDQLREWDRVASYEGWPEISLACEAALAKLEPDAR